jgi:glycosyltransferase involved in cell wall biosynthesis
MHLIAMDPVLIINLSRWFGGAEVRVFDIASALEGRCPYGVVTLEHSSLHEKLQKAKLNVLALPFSRGDFRLALSILRIIKKHGYMIVDMHNPQSHLWGMIASKMAGLSRTVTTVHNSRDLTAPFIKTLLYEKVMQMNALLDSNFIAVSPSVHKYLTTLHIRSERISMVPNGIAIPDPSRNHDRSELRRSFGWDENHFVVIVVGRLESVKGHAFLIEALKSVVQIHSNIRCFFAGDGRERHALQSQVKASNLENYVHFAGFREDISSLLAASDLFCMPSLSEGLPYALLEACACRLPVLVTQVGGMAEFLKQGETAVMVSPQNAETLSKGLLSMIEDPRKAKAMGDAAFELVRQQLSIEKMISKTLSIYSGLGNET